MSKVVAGLRVGGRSARIQEAVHQAVLDLQQELKNSDINVPIIAKKAGVTPSTIYRRWGNLSSLLSDVALSKLKPDYLPQSFGSFKADLSAWVEQYYEEYTSEIGKSLLNDIVSESENQKQCYELIEEQLNIIQERAIQKGESYIDNDIIIEIVVSPIIYMTLFSRKELDASYISKLLERVFQYLP